MAHNTARHMILVAFMQASNCSNYSASWRHPTTELHFLTPDYYQHIARVLEAGTFHLAFFDDRLAMPSQYGDSFAESLRHGIRVVKLDLVPVMTAMALATRHLGIGATYSTTYYPPFTWNYHEAEWLAPFDAAVALGAIHSHHRMVKGIQSVSPANPPRLNSDNPL